MIDPWPTKPEAAAPAARRCEVLGCNALVERGQRFCRRCREESDALDEMFFKDEREREMKELRAAFRRADWKERVQHWIWRFKASPRVWLTRTNWTFLVCAALWAGWELGAAFIAWLRAGQ